MAVHGRTRSQGYSGEADWQVIDQVAQALSVPVIGNGDIRSGEDALRRKSDTAVSGLMIGRAAMQNPWIFREISHFLNTGELLPEIPLEQRWELVLKHCRLAVESGRFPTEKQTITSMRSAAILSPPAGATKSRFNSAMTISAHAKAASAKSTLGPSRSSPLASRASAS